MFDPEREKSVMSDDMPYPLLFLAKDARETRRLLVKGADPNFCTNMGRTALCFAHSPRQAEVLLRAGADINGNDLTSPLHHISDPETMLFLIDKGADVNKQDHFRQTPLFRVKSLACAEILVEHGAKKLLLTLMGAMFFRAGGWIVLILVALFCIADLIRGMPKKKQQTVSLRKRILIAVTVMIVTVLLAVLILVCHFSRGA